MMLVVIMQAFLLSAILVGHTFLWIGVINRLHAVYIHRRLMEVLTFSSLGIAAFVPLGAVGYWLLHGCPTNLEIDWQSAFSPAYLPISIYAAICLLVDAAVLVRWVGFQMLRRPPKLLRLHRSKRLSIAPAQAALEPREHRHHPTVHLPGNEALQLELTERSLEIPRLPKKLDGLTILHFSDLHLTGMVGKAYFREVIRAANELKPDLMAVTGDLVDNQQSIDWIPDTLGKLSAPYGIYVVLGNHDTRVNGDKLRQTLSKSGLVYVGKKWINVDIRGASVIIAGNELPWFSPAADLKNCPPRTTDAGQFRLALSHSPDQFRWAQCNDIDLLLCGHTHAGQIRIPIINSIFCPSLFGVRYDYGLFHTPPTLMHVTRGISGKQPWRWNCRPELALLTLRAPTM